MAPEHGLRVRLLGGLEIEGVPAMSIGSRKARALLRRLAVARGGAVPVEELLAVAGRRALPSAARSSSRCWPAACAARSAPNG